MTTPLLLDAIGIAKSFSGVPALHDGRLSLRAGSVHALCGGNGAGKSTLLNVLMGVLPGDAGTLRIDGQETFFRSPHDALQAGIVMISGDNLVIDDGYTVQ